MAYVCRTRSHIDTGPYIHAVSWGLICFAFCIFRTGFCGQSVIEKIQIGIKLMPDLVIYVSSVRANAEFHLSNAFIETCLCYSRTVSVEKIGESGASIWNGLNIRFWAKFNLFFLDRFVKPIIVLRGQRACVAMALWCVARLKKKKVVCKT